MRKFFDKEKEVTVKRFVYRAVTVGDLRKILNDEGFKKSIDDNALLWCESKYAVCKTICDLEISKITTPELEEEYGLILKAYNPPKNVVKHDMKFGDEKLAEEIKRDKEKADQDAKFGTTNALKFLKEEEVKPSEPPAQPV
jgi:hypothetical protein